MNRVADDSTPAGTSFLSRDGTRIDYERRGSGPALVLVHGGFVDRGFWGPSLPLLAEHFTVYALDRRGHGRSDPYPADHSLEREYEDVAALVAVAGGPVTVLGHSSGAIVAMHAAKRAADVSHLVLYEPPRFDAFTSAVQAQLRVSLAAGDYDQLLATVLVDIVVGTTNPEVLRHARQQVLAGARQSQVWAASLRNVQSIPAEVDSYVGYRFDPKEFRDRRAAGQPDSGARGPGPWGDARGTGTLRAYCARGPGAQFGLAGRYSEQPLLVLDLVVQHTD